MFHFESNNQERKSSWSNNSNAGYANMKNANPDTDRKNTNLARTISLNEKTCSFVTIIMTDLTALQAEIAHALL
uniref:Uncharacterized protein n=1 Tax=Romanomermis culicivorax TaxID=13658 RepID=A0A915K127_ROMCU